VDQLQVIFAHRHFVRVAVVVRPLVRRRQVVLAVVLGQHAVTVVG